MRVFVVYLVLTSEGVQEQVSVRGGRYEVLPTVSRAP